MELDAQLVYVRMTARRVVQYLQAVVSAPVAMRQLSAGAAAGSAMTALELASPSARVYAVL
jgi:hypothetical protein